MRNRVSRSIVVQSATVVAVWVILAAYFWQGGAFGQAGFPTAAKADLKEAQLQDALSYLPGGVVVYVGKADVDEFLRVADFLAHRGNFIVQALFVEDTAVNQARAALFKSGNYGQVSVGHFSGEQLPYAANVINAVIVGSGVTLYEKRQDSVSPGLSVAEALRVLEPSGQLLVRDGSSWKQITKPWPDGIDDWPHGWYGAAGNPVSTDTHVGPPQHLQWLAFPKYSRHHEKMPSVSAVVSAGGRLFYIVDAAPAASILLPPCWELVARDAFNGMLLWKRRIAQWHDHMHPAKNGPVQLAKTLVATKDAVFVTLGLRAAVSKLDGKTGKLVQTYDQTVGTEEILHEGGILYLYVRRGDSNAKAAPNSDASLMAVDSRTGKTLWTIDDAAPLPMSMAVSGNRLVYLTAKEVVCCDAKTGRTLWRSERDFAPTRPKWSAPVVIIYKDVVLVADRVTKKPDATDPVTGRRVQTWLAESGWTGNLVAYELETGKQLWQCPCSENYHAPPDVLVINDLVFVGQSRARTGPDFQAARDIHTGKVVRRFDTSKIWQTTMPHHRCHRERATVRYLITGRTGVEFLDILTGDVACHHWIRGACQFGIIPANGLLYLPPHACACYIEGKLAGFLALAAGERGFSEIRQPDAFSDEQTPPLFQRGPVKQETEASARPQRLHPTDRADWPTYRHDAARSGYCPTEVSSSLFKLWERSFRTKLTQPVVAEGKLLVATVDQHSVFALDAKTGQELWRFTAGGRIDSPPTVCDGKAVFGSADGFVYCLDASNGNLLWKFRAAPAERLIVVREQLESTWPLPGNVLVINGSAYCVAGRSAFLDGGLILYRLDLATGKPLATRRIYLRAPNTGEQPPETDRFEMPGALPDILSSDMQQIYLRHLAFDASRLNPCPAKAHLFSPAGFLDDSWWHRTYWIIGRHYYSGYIGWYFAGRETPAGRLLVFDNNRIYGFGYTPDYYRGAIERRYHLFAINWSDVAPQPSADYQRAARDYPAAGPKKFYVKYAWTQELPVLARAMVATKDKLFLAGPPDTALVDPEAFAGKKGAMLYVVGSANGQVVQRYKLQSLPEYDGMIAAEQRVYLTTANGQLLCLGNVPGSGAQPLPRIEPLEKRLPKLELVSEPGLIAYWKLDEGAGNQARDSSGNGHHVRIAPNWDTSEQNPCLRTDGRPRVFGVPDADWLHFGRDSFSVCLWIKLTAWNCRILGKEQFPKNWWVINVLKDGRTELVLGAGRAAGQSVRVCSRSALSPGNWHHVAYVVDRDANIVSCYIDGRREAEVKLPATFRASLDVSGAPLQIPAAYKPFRGWFDEVRLYRRALTGEDVERIYRERR